MGEVLILQVVFDASKTGVKCVYKLLEIIYKSERRLFQVTKLPDGLQINKKRSSEGLWLVINASVRGV